MAKKRGKPNRREFLTGAVAGTTAGVIAMSLEEKALLAAKADKARTVAKHVAHISLPSWRISTPSRWFCSGSVVDNAVGSPLK